jgi:hypothetical protein
MPNSDHQLLDHTRTSPNEEERESFNPPPSCWPPAGSYMVLLSLIAFPRLLLTSETIDSGDCARSDTVVGAGKE